MNIGEHGILSGGEPHSRIFPGGSVRFYFGIFSKVFNLSEKAVKNQGLLCVFWATLVTKLPVS